MEISQEGIDLTVLISILECFALILSTDFISLSVSLSFRKEGLSRTILTGVAKGALGMTLGLKGKSTSCELTGVPTLMFPTPLSSLSLVMFLVWSLFVFCSLFGCCVMFVCSRVSECVLLRPLVSVLGFCFSMSVLSMIVGFCSCSC